MLMVVCVAILTVLVLSEFTYAKVSGSTCSNCHTMHNSQNASRMRLDDTPITGSGSGECLDCHAETRAVLLRLDCLGCHAQDPGGGTNIINSNWPQIAHNAPTYLSGGNYRYVFTDDTYGHNVHGFGSLIGTDSNLGNNPPGYNSNYDPSTGKYQPGNTAGQVMCAGQNGCHGNRNQLIPYLAMKGTHHADDSILKFGVGFTETGQGGGTGSTSDFTTAGKSYRFLYNVHGGEDSDWQATEGSSDHNEYKGSVYGSSHALSQTWNSIDTISELCAECHGYFHLGGSSGIGSSSPWLRHPTDIVIPNTGEYAQYNTPNTGTSQYSLIAPLARQNIPNSSSGSVTLNSDVVMCLSCHRAHASPYYKIMRWDYKNWPASGTNGCSVCHTSKN
ncbi:MAG: cytochrome c3 family protein [Nitrospirota bacterium]